MDNLNATNAFSALSQPIRLDVFRLLVKAGPKGMQSGEIGDMLDVRQNTMSTNLNILLRSGLVRNERQGRTIRYFADMNGIAELLEFLLEDCCGGQPESCKSLVSDICCSGKC